MPIGDKPKVWRIDLNCFSELITRYGQRIVFVRYTPSTVRLRLCPEADGSEKLVLLNDGFGDHDVAVARYEFCLCRGHQFELLVPDIIAIVVGEEFAVAVVNAGEGDIILSFEGIENGVGIFGVIEGQGTFDV